MEDRPISASQIKKWKECPKKWWFRYISDHPATKRKGEYKDVGSAVHEAIEETLEMEPDISEDRPTDSIKRELESTMLAKYWEFDWENTDVPKKMQEKGETYIERAAKYLAENADLTIKAIELKDTFSVSNEQIDSEFVGIMDIVTDEGVIDWKTGKVREDSEVIQGSVYMAAYGHRYGEYPEYVRFIYLKEEKIRTIKPKDDDSNWNTMIEHAENLLNGIEKGQFPAKPGGHCYFCEWEGWCDGSPVGYGKLDYYDI